jgi:hypothetical protein
VRENFSELLTVESACTDPNQIAINSWTTRFAVHGLLFGEVSIIHWIQSAYDTVRETPSGEEEDFMHVLAPVDLNLQVPSHRYVVAQLEVTY